MSGRDQKTAYAFIAPMVLVVVAFVVLPVVGTFWLSLLREVTYLPSQFVGLSNFARLLKDPQFWQSLRFTAAFTSVCVPLEIGLGLVFALILNERLPARSLLRAAVLVPWAVPTIVSARTWELIYNYSYGLANYIVMAFNPGSQPINWLGSPLSAFAALVIADVWKTTPFVAIILLAGLQTIPEEVYEHAKVDGADLFQRFFKITLPLLKPALAVALIFRTIDTVRIMDLIYVVTNGGPGGSTTSLSLLGYKYFNEGDFGYGSAVAVVVFAVAFVLSISYLKVTGFGKLLR